MKKRIDNILKTTPDGFCIINGQWDIVETNNSFCQISGYGKNKLIGMNLIELTRKGSIKKLFDLKNKITHKGPRIFEAFLKRKNKKIINVEFSVNYVDPAKNGEVFIFIRDITNRKMLEKQILDQKAELEQKNIALKEILYQLEIEKDHIKKNIKSNIEEIIFPSLNRLKLKSSKVAKEIIALIEKDLRDITSSYSLTLNNKSRLTPKETEICNMIKNGLSSKEIARLLCASLRTIENHRQNIRKKLQISNQGVNLTTHLQNF